MYYVCNHSVPLRNSIIHFLCHFFPSRILFFQQPLKNINQLPSQRQTETRNKSFLNRSLLALEVEKCSYWLTDSLLNSLPGGEINLPNFVSTNPKTILSWQKGKRKLPTRPTTVDQFFGPIFLPIPKDCSPLCLFIISRNWLECGKRGYHKNIYISGRVIINARLEKQSTDIAISIVSRYLKGHKYSFEFLKHLGAKKKNSSRKCANAKSVKENWEIFMTVFSKVKLSLFLQIERNKGVSGET